MEDNITFEKAIVRVEEIVAALEDGEKNLDESLRLFEEGIKLARGCSKQLTEAQGKLEMLTKQADGSLTAEPIDL